MTHTLYFKNISGDKNLTVLEKIYWLFICILNYFYSFFLSIDNRCEIKDFKNSKKLRLTESNLSPARYLSDIFWHSLKWQNIKLALGGNLKILEVGCGKGKYGFFFKKKLKNNLDNYLGIDIKLRKEWRKTNKINFKVGNSDQVDQFIKSKNLIITQSAIEHFENDLIFFRKIYKTLNQKKKKIIQIHLMPSYSCLFTYFFHGYRHYNLKSISQITKINKKNSNFEIYKLGSFSLNFFHFKNITLPELFKLRKKKRMKDREYSKTLANKVDSLISTNQKTIFPSFYALVIFHNFKEKVNIK